MSDRSITDPSVTPVQGLGAPHAPTHAHDDCGCGHDHSHDHHHHDHHHAQVSTVRRAGPKVGRNDPCPCGSGQKYKKCCLAA